MQNNFKLLYPEGSKITWKDLDTGENSIVEVVRVESDEKSSVIIIRFQDGLVRTTDLPSDLIQQLN